MSKKAFVATREYFSTYAEPEAHLNHGAELRFAAVESAPAARNSPDRSRITPA